MIGSLVNILRPTHLDLVLVELKPLNFTGVRCYASAMALATVTLTYCGASYTFAEDDQTVLKGRLSCDCEKSRLIRETCDSGFPLLKCGAQIVVVSVVEVGAFPQDRQAASAAS